VSGRLPKYRRAGEAFGNIEITKRDEDILELVYKFRYIQGPQIMALIGGNERQIARRLQALFHHEFLERLVPPSQMRLAGSPKMTYVLAPAGAAYLADKVYECPMKELGWRAQHTRRTEWFVEHHVGISEFHASMELACESGPELEFQDWRQDKEAQGKCAWKLPRWSEEERFSVSPDAYFAILDRGERRNLFVEIDRGSEEMERIHDKFERYGWYLTHPSYRGKYARSEDVRVLIVTTSPVRMKNMMGMVQNLMDGLDYKGRPYRKVPGLVPGWFWFTTAGEYNVSEPERLLTPIWRTVKAPNKTLALFK
jgi:hypothetical protein